MTFQEKLVKLRKLKGINQSELATAVGVSRQAVYKWESGQSYPEVAKLIELKALFNISIDDLLDDNYEVVLPEKPKRRSRKAIEVKEEAAVEAPVIAEVKEEAAVVPNEVVTESITEAAPVEENIEKEDAVSNDADKDEPKKRGFFARLFGG